MGCEEVHAQFADYLAGTLPRATEAEVESHLHECRACAAEAEDLRETWALLGTIRSERPDSAALRARFEASLTGYEHGLGDRRTVIGRLKALGATLRPFQAGPARFGYYAAQAAFALAVLILGVVVGRQTAPSPAPDSQISMLREELREMRQIVTISLLQQQSASERLRGVSWSNQLDMPGSEVVTALLDALKHDQNVNVRLASIDALKRFAHEEVVRRACIDALSQQSSPLVQIALIDFMVETGEHESISTLRRLSQDPMLNEAVRSRATLGLERLGAA